MGGSVGRGTFEAEVLPHLDAAHNLARWITGNSDDAADMVQEAVLRAFRFFDTHRPDNPKAWLLTILRNTCFSFLKARARRERPTDLEALGIERPMDAFDPAPVPRREETPETLLRQAETTRQLAALVAALPPEFREALVLREQEDLSYKEIAEITGVPVGTVMSRLSRARRHLQSAWLRAEAE